MKIVQSFWSGGIANIDDNTFGWKTSYYHLLSWVLSANLLAKHYNDVELYTDQLGYDILIKKLQLPYTKVQIVLDNLNNYDSNLWALAKLRTYKLQKESFIHVDGDVFIWNKFPKRFNSKDLIAQNLELITDYYKNMWQNIRPHLKFIPKEISIDEQGLLSFACNMGIVGGDDLTFFRDFCNKAFDFVNKNKTVWGKINRLNFNIFFEQVLFYQLIQLNNVKPEYLFNEIPKDNCYVGFGDFHDVPHKRTFLHLIGEYKTDTYSINAMRDMVIKEYPIFYDRILRIINNKKNEVKFNYGFNKKQNLVLENEFKNLILNEKEINLDNKYLFSRNIVYVELTKYFDSLLADKRNFILQRLPCNSIIIENEIKSLNILELGEGNLIIPIDELDEILLEEIGKSKKYSEIFVVLKKYLEDEIIENEKELKIFNKMIADRIRFFITRKVLYCYKKDSHCH